MKTKRILLMGMMAFFLGSTSVSAQGLGDIFKKAKKILDNAIESTNTTTSANGQTTTPKTIKGTEIAIANGGTLINPLPNIVDVQLVGAYGKSTSENYGEVNLILKVKMIANLNAMSIGCNSNYPAIMIDQDGNSYKMRGFGWSNYDVTEGIFINLPLKDSDTFVDVKKTATTIQKLQIGLSTSYENTGLLVLKDVPIQWDFEK